MSDEMQSQALVHLRRTATSSVQWAAINGLASSNLWRLTRSLSVAYFGPNCGSSVTRKGRTISLSRSPPAGPSPR